MRRAIVVHPILFALFPILSLYAANLAIFPIEDTYRPIGIVLLGALILWLLLFLVVRDWKRSGLAVSVAFSLIFGFGYAWSVVVNNYDLWVRLGPKDKFQIVWLVFTGCASLLAIWKWKFSAKLSAAFNWISIVLIALPLYTISKAWLVQLRNSSVTEAVASGASGPAGVLGKPDIFYVILDGYGRKDALQEFLGYDNTAFVNALTRRGFFVADQSHSNYCQTELSLASSLNMGYLQDLVRQDKRESGDHNIITNLIDHNGVANYLKRQGYEYVAITSGAPNILIKSADVHVQDNAKVTLFESTLLEETPMGAPKKKMSNYLYDNRRAHLLSALDLLERSGNPTAKPRFVFAHILAPHPPFVVGPQGEPITPPHPFSFEDGTYFYGNGGTPAEYQQGYLGQLEYLNKRVVAAVDDIIKQEHVPPIIILQGDHGSKKGWNPDSLPKTNVREVYRNLNAYYVPQPIRQKLYTAITPVNSFRLILDCLFGDTMPTLPDRSYFSTINKPLAFDDVPSERIGDPAITHNGQKPSAAVTTQ